VSTVKRFAVFSGERFYPSGGWYDYRSSYDTLDEAVEAPTSGDWRHIVDQMTGQIVVILVHDAESAKSVRCHMCMCEAPRTEGGVHVDSDRLGLSADTPCERVFAMRDGTGWLAFVDGSPLLLHEQRGEVLRFSSVTAAYHAAQEAAPKKGPL